MPGRTQDYSSVGCPSFRSVDLSRLYARTSTVLRISRPEIALGGQGVRRSVCERMRVPRSGRRRPVRTRQRTSDLDGGANRGELGNGAHLRRDCRRATTRTEACAVGAGFVVPVMGVLCVVARASRHLHTVHGVLAVHGARLKIRRGKNRAEPECPEAGQQSQPERRGTRHVRMISRLLDHRERNPSRQSGVPG